MKVRFSCSLLHPFIKMMNFFYVLDFELNRNLYRTSNTRPPYTYVSLIRQAIIESPQRQLPTTEILDWFENNFSFFRNNTASLAWEVSSKHLKSSYASSFYSLIMF
jgi:hypothetical protein